jgi:hypothetical protein
MDGWAWLFVSLAALTVILFALISAHLIHRDRPEPAKRSPFYLEAMAELDEIDRWITGEINPPARGTPANPGRVTNY